MIVLETTGSGKQLSLAKWGVLTFVSATFPNVRSSDIDIRRQDGDAAVKGGGSILIPVRGDVHNSRNVWMWREHISFEA